MKKKPQDRERERKAKGDIYTVCTQLEQDEGQEACTGPIAVAVAQSQQHPNKAGCEHHNEAHRLTGHSIRCEREGGNQVEVTVALLPRRMRRR